MDTVFKNNLDAKQYLQSIRGGIPFGVAQMELAGQLLEYFVKQPQKAIDLGCGDGVLSEFLLQMYPQLHITCIDHSDAMLGYAKKRLNTYASQVTFVLDDLSEGSNLFKNSVGDTDIVISGYAIHHLPNTMKYRLYEAVFSCLRSNGLFLNMEHTASASFQLERIHDKLFVDFLSDYNNQDRDQVEKSYRQRTDQYDNILEHVEIQLGWLRQIGFHHVDCYFKYMELALFGGVK